MKKQLILGVGLALASSAALAQSSPVLDRPSTPPTATDPTDIKKPADRPGTEPVTPNSAVSKGDLLNTFEAIDRDADGRISRAEARPNTALTGDFIKLDRNSDGFLNAGEFKVFSVPSRMSKASETPTDQFGSLDTNHDGKLSRDEVKSDTTLTARFRRIDSNNDGSMSKEEFTASIDSNKTPPVGVERKSENSPVPADPTKSDNKNPLETKKN